MRTLTNNWLHMAMTILLSVASNDITASKYPSTRSTPMKSAFHKVNKVDHMLVILVEIPCRWPEWIDSHQLSL